MMAWFREFGIKISCNMSRLGSDTGIVAGLRKPAVPVISCLTLMKLKPKSSSSFAVFCRDIAR
jgi:hypothetical protein